MFSHCTEYLPLSLQLTFSQCNAFLPFSLQHWFFSHYNAYFPLSLQHMCTLLTLTCISLFYSQSRCVPANIILHTFLSFFDITSHAIMHNFPSFCLIYPLLILSSFLSHSLNTPSSHNPIYLLLTNLHDFFSHYCIPSLHNATYLTLTHLYTFPSWY